MKMTTAEIVQKAVEEAMQTVRSNMGGPFGAAIVDETGKLYLASNTVLASHDPTSHAEVNVIRKVCAEKQSHDLSGSILYTTCYPCPMCISACIWANIREIHYGCTAKDAMEIGFRDDFIYDFILGGCKDTEVLTLTGDSREACLPLFAQYSAEGKQLY